VSEACGPWGWKVLDPSIAKTVVQRLHDHVSQEFLAREEREETLKEFRDEGNVLGRGIATCH
jgi:hypothetical protein